MKPDNNLNKPDPMAEDDKSLDKLIIEMFDKALSEVDVPGMPKVLVFPIHGDGARAFAKKKINAYTTNKIIEAKHQVLHDLLSWWAYEQRNIEQNKVNATYNEIVLDKFDWLYAIKVMNAMKDPRKPFVELKALNHRKDES